MHYHAGAWERGECDESKGETRGQGLPTLQQTASPLFPLFEKERLGEIFKDEIPLAPPFSKGEVQTESSAIIHHRFHAIVLLLPAKI